MSRWLVGSHQCIYSHRSCHWPFYHVGIWLLSDTGVKVCRKNVFDTVAEKRIWNSSLTRLSPRTLMRSKSCARFFQMYSRFPNKVGPFFSFLAADFSCAITCCKFCDSLVLESEAPWPVCRLQTRKRLWDVGDVRGPRFPSISPLETLSFSVVQTLRVLQEPAPSRWSAL